MSESRGFSIAALQLIPCMNVSSLSKGREFERSRSIAEAHVQHRNLTSNAQEIAIEKRTFRPLGGGKGISETSPSFCLFWRLIVEMAVVKLKTQSSEVYVISKNRAAAQEGHVERSGPESMHHDEELASNPVYVMRGPPLRASSSCMHVQRSGCCESERQLRRITSRRISVTLSFVSYAPGAPGWPPGAPGWPGLPPCCAMEAAHHRAT
jgi:hypothetical protein